MSETTSDLSQVESKFSKLLRLLKLRPVVLLFLATFLVVAFLNPAKVGLVLWGLCKLALFAFVGDWVDKQIFPDAQPENLDGIEEGTASKRKVWVVCASILAGALLP